MMETSKEWINELNVGDVIVIEQNFSSVGNAYTLSKVEKITNNYIVVRGIKFDKVTGWQVAEKYQRRKIIKLTEEIKEKILHARIADKVASISYSFDYQNMKKEDLVTILNILEKYGKESS